MVVSNTFLTREKPFETCTPDRNDCPPVHHRAGCFFTSDPDPYALPRLLADFGSFYSSWIIRSGMLCGSHHLPVLRQTCYSPATPLYEIVAIFWEYSFHININPENKKFHPPAPCHQSFTHMATADCTSSYHACPLKMPASAWCLHHRLTETTGICIS